MSVLKIATHWLRCGIREAKKLKNKTQKLHKSCSWRSLHVLSVCPSVTKCSFEEENYMSIACDFQSTLLTTRSFFPFFMLLAFEGGGLIRAFLLLILYPVVLLLGELRDHNELSLRIMCFVTFFGLRKKDVDLVARTVLPKFFLENLDEKAYDVWAMCKGKKVVVSGVPRVMVEWFLREYLGADEVFGVEIGVFCEGKKWSFFTGFLLAGTFGIASKHKVLREVFGEKKADIGLLSYGNPHHHVFLSNCKQTYIVNKDRERSRSILPRSKYPKTLIFHDGRLAFLPTPLSSMSMFLFLPFGFFLFLLRSSLSLLLPIHLSHLLSPFTGLLLHLPSPPPPLPPHSPHLLLVSNHRTLLDPLFISASLRLPLTALTYSLSPLSELFSPIPTSRLSRSRSQDSLKISRLLQNSHIVLCPEGTTCREPYLLRFSALFAQLSRNILPVAIDTHVSMFYGTTATGFKFLDPVFFSHESKAGLYDPLPRCC